MKILEHAPVMRTGSLLTPEAHRLDSVYDAEPKHYLNHARYL